MIYVMVCQWLSKSLHTEALTSHHKECKTCSGISIKVFLRHVTSASDLEF